MTNLVVARQDIDAVDHRGMSGYVYACEYGCDESAAALIQAGCNKGIVNREGFTGEDRAREYATRGFNRTSVLAVIASTVLVSDFFPSMF